MNLILITFQFFETGNNLLKKLSISRNIESIVQDII